MSIPLNTWITSSEVVILPEDELNALVHHRYGWHDSELGIFTNYFMFKFSEPNMDSVEDDKRVDQRAKWNTEL